MNRLLPALLASAVAALVLDWSLQPVLGRDTDFWWHLAAGREIWTLRSVPLVDSFSHTFGGQPWVRLHWLFQALLYGAWRVGGMDLAVGLRSLLFLGAMALLARACGLRGAGMWASGGAVLWVAWIAARYSFVRPHFASLLLGALLLVVLETARRPGRERVAFWAFPVLVVWSNMHGGVAMVGVAMVVVYAVVGGLTAWRWVVPLSVAAVFLVPQPLAVFDYGLAWSFQDNPFRDIITEFKRPSWFGEDAGSLVFLGVYVGGAMAGRRWLDLLLGAAFAPLLLTGWRHQFLLIPFLAPGMAVTLSACERKLKAPSPHLRRALAGVLVFGLVFVLARETADVAGRAWPPSRLIRQETLPVVAVDTLRASGMSGRLFNDLNWGGYLVWALPESTVYVDSRCDQVYVERAFLDEYTGVLFGRRPDALAVLERRGVDLVVENPLFAGAPLFTRQLAGDARWKRFPGGLWAHDRTDVRATDDFMTRFDEGQRRLREQAFASAEQAFAGSLELYPDFAVAWLQRGLAQAMGGQEDEAERSWRRALRIHPELAGAHFNLGVLARQRGRMDEAACELARELALDPTHAGAKEALGRLPAPGMGCRVRAVWDWLVGPFRW